ncbi:MAG: VWA domain-containing protein [Oscillospiraceae bacterium]|nr:VWA domain-containing protein [Oscillospiraceae bacterium]
MATKTAVNPLEGVGKPTKPNLVVFFVIDKSYSMAGASINAVNHAMREIIPILKDIDGQDADLKVAALTFSAGAEWVYSNPQDAEELAWVDVEADGWTDFGAACDELCSKMSRSAYMASKAGYKKPVVILLTDGEPTDNWEPKLAKLKQNRWFQVAFKIGLAVDDANEDVLGEFVGTKKGKNGKYEGVYRIDDANKLKTAIKVVIVTSSEIGSRSMPIDINVADADLDDKQHKDLHDMIEEKLDDDDAFSDYAATSDDDEEWD